MTLAKTSNLKNDPRVAEAKRLILEAVHDQNKDLTEVMPAKEEFKASYKEALEQIAKTRGIPMWYPYIGSGIGRGPLVKLLDGSVKYDFIGGIGVHHLGHSHPELIAASIDASHSDIVMQGNLQLNSDSAELIELLVNESGLDHCFLTSSGSMANENGLKMALQKSHPADRILAFKGCFCGRTITMTQITEKPQLRDGLPMTMGVDYLPFFNPDEPEKSTREAVDTLKHYLWRHPDRYSVMIFEMIQGEGGYYPGSKDFFRAIMEILKENNIGILVDEVQTFGRTSRLFAFQHFGLEDLVDIVTIGKLPQICATLYTKEFSPRSGLISQTYTGSTQSIHAAKTIINLMNQEGFFGEEGKNMQIHRRFVKNFEDIQKRHPSLISGPHGMGAMVAFTPMNCDMKKTLELTHKLFENGVLSFICGREPTRIRFLVPVGAVTFDDVDAVTKIVEETLLECM